MSQAVSEVVRQVCASIGPASAAHAEGARLHVAAAGIPLLERLALTLGGAQHTPRPRARPRTIVVVAGDHGCGDPGVSLGPEHPTAVAARAIAAGTAALCQVARAAETPILLLDAGAREPAHLPPSVVTLGQGPSSDLFAGPAMTVDAAAQGLEAGIAAAMSVAETMTRAADGAPAASRPAALALGALGLGAEVASAALLGAATGRPPAGLGDPAAEQAGARGAAMTGADGIAQLAAFGGPETAVLAGLILGAAAIDLPVILDGHATGAAALVAAALAPPVTGYLIAAHRGTFTHPAILAHLGLGPVFEAGLGHGEGTGAAMALALLDQVAALVTPD